MLDNGSEVTARFFCRGDGVDAMLKLLKESRGKQSLNFAAKCLKLVISKQPAMKGKIPYTDQQLSKYEVNQDNSGWTHHVEQIKN